MQSLKRRSSPRPKTGISPVTTSADDPLAFSEDGAIDLSVKKPRYNASTLCSVDRTRTPPSRDQSNYTATSTAAAQSFAAHLQPLMAGLSGNSGISDLSLSLAAAAAGLFPPLFDPSLFYQPSMLAALVGTSQGAMPTSAAAAAGSSLAEKPHGRGRGRRRGSGRGGRTSSMFISSLFAQQQSVAVGGAEEVKASRGRGSRGRGRGRGRGNGPGRPRTESAPTMALSDLEVNLG